MNDRNRQAAALGIIAIIAAAVAIAGIAHIIIHR
jgi:hypothetical protein